MVETMREIERKYESADRGGLPDLTGVAGISSVVDRGTTDLDATYYDTEGERLAADGITLRRRTGGGDAGWHLKLPVASGAVPGAAPGTVREEVRAPLSDAVPPALAALVRSRVRDAALVPLARLRTERAVQQLVGPQGALLAETCVDRVSAQRLAPWESGTVTWTEIEVELADGADPGFLDLLEPHLTGAGLHRSAAPSKLARVLEETRPGRRKHKKAKRKKAKGARSPQPPEPTAGDHVLDYLRRQVRAIVELDPAVRRDRPDSVHRMRVATRRLRSALRSYSRVLDRSVTDPIGEELRWLAAELGIDRDREVLTARLHERLGELPRPLVIGPVRGRLRTWSRARRTGSRRRLTAVLDGPRYLSLLGALDTLLADPPLRPAAARPAGDVIPRAVLRDVERVAARLGTALAAPPGTDRDTAMHEARKAAKRARYAAEAARPAIGGPAKELARQLTVVQEVLGDHQDSVVARQALRELAVQAHAAGESSFTLGVLYGREEQRAAACERELPELAKLVAGGGRLVAGG